MYFRKSFNKYLEMQFFEKKLQKDSIPVWFPQQNVPLGLYAFKFEI
jgi:hypothetical protein